MDNSLIAIIVGVLGLFGWGMFNKIRKDSAESLLQNIETKEQANEIDKNIIKNEGLEASEEAKRKEILDALEKASSNKVSIKDILDFFNKK